MLEAFQGDSKLNGPVVTAMHLVQAPVEISAPGRRHVRLEENSVAVAGRLIFFVDVGHITRAHLVAGKESNGLLDIARVVPLLLRLDKLVMCRNERYCVIVHICVVQVSEARFQPIIEVTKVKVEVAHLVKLQTCDTILNLLHLHRFD